MEITLEEIFGDDAYLFNTGWRFLTVDSKNMAIVHMTLPEFIEGNGDIGYNFQWRSSQVMLFVPNDTTHILDAVKGLQPKQQIFRVI